MATTKKTAPPPIPIRTTPVRGGTANTVPALYDYASRYRGGVAYFKNGLQIAYVPRVAPAPLPVAKVKIR